MPAFTIKPAALSPFVRFAARICSLFGVLLVHPSGDDTKPSSRGYSTLTAALAAWTAGKLVVVCPGTYAETVTHPDGCRVILLGSTVGIGAGPAFSPDVDDGGEVCYIQGWGTIAGTTSLNAPAGSHFVLGPGIELAGAFVGTYRVGRTWYLPSGAAIATYCPADGSVVAIAVGDTLNPHQAIAGGEHLTCYDISGTKHWRGKARALYIDGVSSSSTGTTDYVAPMPSWATGVIWDSWEVSESVSTTNDSGNNWTLTLDYAGYILDSWTTWSPTQQSAGRYYLIRRAIGAYTPIPASGADRGSSRLDYLTRTKNSAPGSIWYKGSITYCPVAA